MARWAEPPPERRPHLAAAVGLLVALPYWAGGAVWDDHNLIVHHLATLPSGEVVALWWQPVGLGDTGAAYYRPVAMTLLALLGRLSIPAIHVLAGALHAVSAALVCHLGGCTRAALAGALLFAAHPVVWEVLGWASALPDALAVCAGLGVLWAAQARRPGLAAGLAAVGVASKETALVWLVVGALGGRFDRRTLLAVLGGAAGVLGLRTFAGATGLPPVQEASVAEAVQVVVHQLGTLIWSFPLSPLRDTHHLDWTRSLAGSACLVGLAAVAWRGDRWRRALAVGVVLPVILALPTVLSSHLAGDRYIYAALAMVALLVGQLAVPARVVAGALLASGLLILTAHRQGAATWKTDLALFEQAVRAQPQSAYAHHLLGHAHGMQGDWPGAATAFHVARGLDGAHPLSAQLALQASVLAGDAEVAAQMGRSGPKDGLTADWIGWWARAELEAGHPERAAPLIQMLRRPDGSFDGPPFVSELAQAISASP